MCALKLEQPNGWVHSVSFFQEMCILKCCTSLTYESFSTYMINRKLKKKKKKLEISVIR